jgi:hypothetical protein
VSPAVADDHAPGRDHHAKHPAEMRDPRAHRYHSDPRSVFAIRSDPHFRIGAYGYRPRHEWQRYHLARGGWFRAWGITTWNGVGAITCEAVNQDTGQMYPVVGDRSSYGWNDDGVNLILDQALDNCYADGGGGACTPITPACRR